MLLLLLRLYSDADLRSQFSWMLGVDVSSCSIINRVSKVRVLRSLNPQRCILGATSPGVH